MKALILTTTSLLISLPTHATEDSAYWERQSSDAIARARDFKAKMDRKDIELPAIELDRQRILQKRRDEAEQIEKARRLFVLSRSKIDASTHNDEVEQALEKAQQVEEQKQSIFRKIYINARDRHTQVLNGPGFIEPMDEEGLTGLTDIFKNETREKDKTSRRR